jgi:hypothetical protein
MTAPNREALDLIAAVRRSQGMNSWQVVQALRAVGGGRRDSYHAAKPPASRLWRIMMAMAAMGAKNPPSAASKFVLYTPVSIVVFGGFVVLPFSSVLINRMSMGHIVPGLLGVGLSLGTCAVMAGALRWLIRTMQS